MIKMKSSMDDIRKKCDDIISIFQECIVEEFIEWAKQDDVYLRSNQGFYDHTGNLRSSLGAAVIKNASAVYKTPFAVVLGGSKGASEGRKMVEQMSALFKNRIVKVMVAGMDYAQKVEDIDSKDVLESRRIQCERDAKAVIERACMKAEQKIKTL